MTTIKIGDLLDFSSHLAASTSPSNEPPRLKGTVHHRPPGYRANDSRNRKTIKATNQITRNTIKVEKISEDEKCPNILVRNGVMCMPYRPHVKREGEDRTFVISQGRRKSGGDRVVGGQRADVMTETGVCGGDKKEKGKSLILNFNVDKTWLVAICGNTAYCFMGQRVSLFTNKLQVS